MGETAALMTSLFGTGLNAFGQIQSGRESGRIADINARSIRETAEENAILIEEGSEENARIGEYNAGILEAKARDATRRGYEDESRFRIGIRGLIGEQRAGFAGQGVDVSTGSPIDVVTDTAYQGNLDALTIRTNAGREAWGYTAEAENERMQSAAQRRLGKLQARSTRRVGESEALSTRMSGSAARRAGILGGTATLVGGAGQALYQQYGFRKRTR